MVEALGPGAVQFDVVRSPPDAELLAAGRELTDEVGEARVVGVPARLSAQDPDDVVGDVVPVHEELGRRGVEEREPRRVDRPFGVGEEVAEEGLAELVRRQEVGAGVEDEGGRVHEQVEDLLHVRPHPFLRGAAPKP